MRRLVGPIPFAATLLLASCVPAARGEQPATPPEPGVKLRYDIAALLDEEPVLAGAEPRAADTPAPPFRLAGRDSAARATECLTAAIYYEARSEGEAGQRAVAQVVLNRVRHRDYPSTVCGVVYQHVRGQTCQFSFSCDGSMRRRRETAAWAEARRIAEEALAGSVYAPVGLATHYHTFAVSPGWGRRLARVTSVGSHIFYRSHGEAGRLAAFVRAAPSPSPARSSQPAEPPGPALDRPDPQPVVASAAPQPGFALLADDPAEGQLR